jgi:hypothetical protein
MTLPRVTITELTRALGALPPSTNLPMAIVAPADDGPLNTPGAYSRVEDVEADFVGGHLVQLAAYHLANYGGPVVVCRCNTSIDGSAGAPVAAADGTVSAITKTGMGTSTFTIAAGALPNGAYSVKVRFPTGGTRGTAGIIYEVSLDGGATYGLERALGTATSFTIPNAGSITVNVSAGTIVDNDFITFTTTAPVLASAGSLVISFAGTSVPTIDASSEPNGYYEGYVEFVDGGTVGAPGITYRESLDGGRTMSPLKALGAASYLVLAESGGVRINLSAGTIVAGDSVSFSTVPPLPNGADVGAALDALAATSIRWQFVQLGGEVDALTFQQFDSKVAAMRNVGKERWGMCHARMPNVGESRADYKTAIDGVFASLRATVFTTLTVNACKTISGLDGREYRWPTSPAAASIHASVSLEENVAAKDIGRLKNVRIVDDNGNPDEYDERVHGGLDDSGYLVLRTWEGQGGAFVNIPRIFSAPGSDVRLIPHRRVLAAFNETLRVYFEDRLNKPTVVDSATGYILPSEAVEMERGAEKAARAVLGARPMVSDLSVVVARDDDLLHTEDPHITVTGRIVPLVYPQGFDITTGFIAPANNVVTA